MSEVRHSGFGEIDGVATVIVFFCVPFWLEARTFFF